MTSPATPPPARSAPSTPTATGSTSPNLIATGFVSHLFTLVRQSFCKALPSSNPSTPCHCDRPTSKDLTKMSTFWSLSISHNAFIGKFYGTKDYRVFYGTIKFVTCIPINKPTAYFVGRHWSPWEEHQDVVCLRLQRGAERRCSAGWRQWGIKRYLLGLH